VKCYTGPWIRTDFLKQPKQWKMDMRFGTMNVRSLYRSGPLKTASRELTKYKLDLVGVQVRWDKGGTEPSDDCTFLYENGNADHHLGTGSFVPNSTISAVTRVEFVSDRMSYLILRGCWCDIIFLNGHTSTENKRDDIKDSFYEELERAFDQFPKYHVKILLGNFNAKVGREDIFKITIGNENSHENSYDNGIRVVN
jgi:hypothetical protein